jgi:hypothetical protein
VWRTSSFSSDASTVVSDRQPADLRVRHDQHVPQAHVPKVHADLTG